MAFGLGKLQTLETKLNIYEDLSKEMLDKLERAVTTISDNSNKIAIVLERHENRLDESERSDQHKESVGCSLNLCNISQLLAYLKII